MTDTDQQPEQLTPRESALADIDYQQGVVAHWHAEKAAAEAELASLQARAGDEVLADPEAAERLTGDMQRLRARVDIASRAVAAAEPRLLAAKRRALLAEAEEWDADAKIRREALERHEARVAQLLAALEKFDGRKFVPASIPPDAQLHVAYEIGFDKGSPLRQALQRAELRAMILREVADGRNPQAELQVRVNLVDSTIAGVPLSQLFPASVRGPDAIVPLSECRALAHAES